MVTDIDLAMARFLSDPGSGSILALLREARRGSMGAVPGKGEAQTERYDQLLSDCRCLYHAALVLESDPEIINRNTLARVLAGISPLIQAMNGANAMMVKGPWEALMEVGAVVSEVASASQYLESAVLATEQHYREDLLRVEDRLMSMALNKEDIPDPVMKVQALTDALLALDIPSGSKPMVPFVMWTLIVTIDYTDLVSE